MEGLGLSALAAGILLAPGICFILGLNRPLHPGVPAAIELWGPSLFFGLLAAALAHLLGLAVVGGLSTLLPGVFPADPASALILLGASVADERGLSAVHALTDHWAEVGSYFAVQVSLCYWLGKRARSLTRPSGWFALLTNTDSPQGEALGIVLTAEVCLAGEALLYSGMVAGFQLDRAGELDYVVLEGARRKQLETGDNQWTQLRGERMVLRMKEARTVNLDYVFITDLYFDAGPDESRTL